MTARGLLGSATCSSPYRSLLPFALVLFTLATCTYDGADESAVLPTVGSLELRSSEPSAGAVAVSRNSIVDLLFSVPIAGESVGDVSVRLFSSRIEVPGSVSVDQLARRVRFTPFDELRSGLRYRVRVSNKIRGLDGSTLPEPIIFDFTTGTSSEAARPAPVSAIDDATVQQLWDSRCGGCHAGPAAALGLDLSSESASRRSLIGVQSVEVSLLRVAPGKHAESFLMRKLLDKYNTAGMPMPPSGDLLDSEALRTVAQWIDTLDVK